MRVRWLVAATVLSGILACAQSSTAPADGQFAGHGQSTPPGQLVREVVYNELNDHTGHGYWRYWIQRRTQSGTRLEQQVETASGPVTRLAASNGRPLDAAARAQEHARLEHLLNSPQEQARHQAEYAEDEKRIGRILALLADAFLYEYAGEDNGIVHLRFQPNPSYVTHSVEARVFHAMAGDLWIDARMKRLARLDGHIAENVDFGFGILGRLYKGGWFRLVRTQVGPTDWKTAQLEMHMSVRALLLKTFARETSEDRGGFVRVPAETTLYQAMHLLEEPVEPPATARRAAPIAVPAALAER